MVRAAAARRNEVHDVISMLAEYRRLSEQRGKLKLSPSRSNPLMVKIQALFQEIRLTSEGRAGIVALLDDPDVPVRLMAASHVLKWDPEKAIPALEGIDALRGDDGFNANMLLKIHRGQWPPSHAEVHRNMELHAYSLSIRAKVDEFGWTAVAVDDKPPFCYTVGLWRLLDHPEILVAGLPDETAKWILDRAVAMIKGTGRPLLAGTTIGGVMDDFPVAIRTIDAPRLSDLGFAADLYGGVVYTALQIVWPDRAKQFPWDPGASADFRRVQPLFFSGDGVGSERHRQSAVKSSTSLRKPD